MAARTDRDDLGPVCSLRISAARPTAILPAIALVELGPDSAILCVHMVRPPDALVEAVSKEIRRAIEKGQIKWTSKSSTTES